MHLTKITTFNRAGEIPQYLVEYITKDTTHWISFEGICPRLEDGTRQYYKIEDDNFVVIARRRFFGVTCNIHGKEYLKVQVLFFIFKKEDYNQNKFYNENDKYLDACVRKTCLLWATPCDSDNVFQRFNDCIDFYNLNYKDIEKYKITFKI